MSWLGLFGGAAWACSFAVGEPFFPEPFASDGERPPEPVVTVTVVRGRGQGGCQGATSSCDDVGRVVLTFADLPDDTAAVVRVLSGRLPAGAAPPGDPVRPIDGTIVLTWVDEATDVQEPFEAVLEVLYVQMDGDASKAVTLTAADPGSDGCGGPGAGMAFGLVLPWVRRRPSRVARSG
ncbi:MAG: hypothetical protein KC656_01530 [Myxococcales bacterium]|nr:hypothetical protein [Myxococcales bacterium]